MALQSTPLKPIVQLDEAVVNKICAGEVIHRPFNAVKELIENSLDAGATNITVTLEKGGLKSITIQDNGHGIRKKDLEIVCNRFTTSKLSNFDDMLSLNTFGFRGEALSSIAIVSHLTIITKPQFSTCGYKAEYIDGLLKPNTPILPVSAADGTLIIVENLFYNMPTRKSALSSEAFEFHLVQDLITNYAILHSEKCAFTLRKSGESKCALHTTLQSSLLNNINNIFHQNISPHLISLNLQDERLAFSLEGLFSNANINLKRFSFLLFINQRLVNCAPLKKTIYNIYRNHLKASQNSFIMLNLKIAPNNIDVNIHPTKSEVCFLHQEEIFELITNRIVEALNDATNSHLPAQNSGTNAQLANKKIPITSLETPGRLDRTENKSREQFRSIENSFKKVSNFSPKHINNNNHGGANSSQSPKTQSVSQKPYNHVRTDNKEQRINQYIQQKSELRQRRRLDLSSLCHLRSEVFQNSDNDLLNIIMESTFVGCVDEKYILLQNETDLLLADSHALNQELFYQIILVDFGNFDYIDLSEPLSIGRLLSTYFKVNNTPNIVNMEETIRELTKNVMALAEMLDDYFSLQLDAEHGTIKTLPCLIEGHVPCMQYLPDFVYRLCSDVNWHDEETCFLNLATEFARLYARPPLNVSSDDDYQKWSSQFSEAIYPLYKSLLLPSTKLTKHETFHTVVNINDLYRVFERC